MFTSPVNSQPFLVPTGTVLGNLTVYLFDREGAVLISTPGLALTTPVSLAVAPAGQIWVQLIGLPDLVAPGVQEATLLVLLTSSGAVLATQTISAGLAADLALQGLGGSNPAVLTVEDGLTTAPLSGATLSVWNSTLTALVSGPIQTDVDGVATFALPVGNFKVLAFLSGAGFANPYPLVISGGPVALTILGSLQIVTAPTMPMVTVYGYVLDPESNPVVDAPVTLALDTTEPQLLSSIGVTADQLIINTNSLGYFEFLVFGGLRVTLSIPSINFSKSGVLPASGTVSLAQLSTLFN